MSHKSDLSHLPVPTELEILEQTTVFRGYFRVDAYELRHGLFEGGWSGVMRREVFERGHAVAVLPYDPDLGVFVMCQQFRVGAYAAGMEPWQLEIVAGIIEEGETPEAVGLREAEEEAGRTVTELWPIQRYLATPGGSSESIYLYLGRVSAEGAGGIFGLPGEDEHIRVSVMSEAELRALMDAGQLTNAATLLAAQWFFLNRERVLAKWKKK
ncbi:MAG: NUDIX domain-containing protein [Rhodospirillaceae bacterium]|nr:NUDIX domain-containing protein [Rhodospirillaceae bacterium]